MGKRVVDVDEVNADDTRVDSKRARRDGSSQPPHFSDTSEPMTPAAFDAASPVAISAPLRPKWALAPGDVPARAKKIYCILRGVKPGFYFDWFGFGAAEEQVRGFRDNLFLSFPQSKKASLKPGNIDQNVRDAIAYMNHDETCCQWNCSGKCRVEDLCSLQHGAARSNQLAKEKPKNKSLCRSCQDIHPSRGNKLCEACFSSPEFLSKINACVLESSLVEEQARVLTLVARGKNVFFTGSAGTGKSRVLKAITTFFKRTGVCARVIAPTGIAALAVEGTTIHTYAGLTVKLGQASLGELREVAREKKVWKRFSETDVLIIDEISMVESDLLTRLSAMMDEAILQGTTKKPFGGVQIVITGDFLQLPPVKPFSTCIECAEGTKEQTPGVYACETHGAYYDMNKWAFKSPAWGASEFTNVHLRQIHRQANANYTRILQRVRDGSALTTDQRNALLSSDKNVDFQTAIKLAPLRREVQTINDQHMSSLSTSVHSYGCVDDFLWNTHHTEYADPRQPGGKSRQPLADLKFHRYEPVLELKEGMQVLLLHNLDIDAGLVNGTTGIILGFEQMKADTLPRAMKKSSKDVATKGELLIRHKNRRYAAQQIREFWAAAADQSWPIVRFQSGLERTIYADCSITELGRDEPYSLLSRTQVPLIAGWAITIHKSQGMTLDNVIVDLGNCFTPGQAYVALSRAKSLQSMKVQHMPSSDKIAPDLTVQSFMEETFGSPSVQTLDRSAEV